MDVQISPEPGDPDCREWYVFRCPVPTRARAADAYLTRGIGPLLAGLGHGDWSFARTGPASVDVYVRSEEPAILAARLAGLGAAAGLPGPERRRLGAVPDGGGRQVVDVALDVITLTPVRRARLSAAVDLAMVAAVLCCPAMHRDQWSLREDGRARTDAGVSLGRRWERVSATMRADAHPLARWGSTLRQRREPGRPPGEAFALLHLLHNQIGLTNDDEQRVHATLIRSLSAARDGLRLPFVPHRLAGQPTASTLVRRPPHE
jgi:hypothetical protein